MLKITLALDPVTSEVDGAQLRAASNDPERDNHG
jgi:hypothetical protein